MTPLDRMLALVGKPIPYMLGTGDADGPTARDGVVGFDCAGAAICYAHQLKRHRPGFNRGRWATVSDDINCNSMIEDAEHKQELFVPVDENDVQPGDLIAYPTIYVRRVLRKTLKFIGHVQMVVRTPPWPWSRTRHGFAGLDVVHCHGPNGRVPGVTLSAGDACDRHDEQWGKPQHQTRIVRRKP
jgi:hypothetical protein